MQIPQSHNNMATDNRPNAAALQGLMEGHYRSLIKALAVAMTKCVVWRERENGTPYTAKELFEYAKKFDGESRLAYGHYFFVSREGAIGISTGAEWQTNWMFIPMEKGKERDFAMRQMIEQLQTERAVQEAVEKAVERGLAAERAAKAAAPLEFCTQCGAPVQPGNKFCENCGKKLV